MNVNEIKLSGKVYKVTDTAKIRIARIMFRNGVNKTCFIDITVPKDLEVKKDDILYVEGNLSVMEKTEQFKFERYFVWATKAEVVTEQASF